jgi:aminoglycoside phosphotransferase (APT) family kinase protein
MFDLNEPSIRKYLEARFAGSVRILGFSKLGQHSTGDLKDCGYGEPVRIDYEVSGEPRSAVLETVAPGPFGHEHMADRAQILLWSHATSNELPLHVRSLDVGGFCKGGALLSLGRVDEFFILNEYVPGEGYNRDLERLRDGAELRDVDVARSDALCDYLVRIHQVRGTNPELYARHTRELVGHNECIMGILDSYPARVDAIDATQLEAVEHASVRWRWRLKGRSHRLRQVHGDFHPWNILFQEGAHFVVLDRSRGEWGDPADDVAALTMNYVFFSLQRSGRLDGAFEHLFSRFWERYVSASKDEELFTVMGPYLAFRGLVMASPVWYPRLASGVRAKLFSFVRAVLEAERFDPSRVNEYCGAR